LMPLRDHPWGRMLLMVCGIMYTIAILLMRDLSRVEV
jgi:Flp pilus assembly protein TadB